MYPLVRFAVEMIVHRNAPPLALGEPHVSHHRIWPWDLDPWKELNNGRTLTLYDLGRLPLAVRGGLIAVLKKKGWGLTVAGSMMRYRKRLTLLQKVEMRSRVMGWDHRFVYIEQSMWLPDGSCANHGIIRAAIIHNRRMVPTDEVVAALGGDAATMPLPDWVAELFAADDRRPWPPEQG